MAYKPSKLKKKRYNRYLKNVRNIRTLVEIASKMGKLDLEKTREDERYRNVERIIPDMVLPEEIKNKSYFKDEEEFETAYAKAEQFRNLERYFTKNYKNKRLDLLKDKIADIRDEVYFRDAGSRPLEPESVHGTYTREQQEQYPALKDYMTYYNIQKRMSTAEFMEAYFGGWIKPFKYIYHEKVVSDDKSTEETSQLSQALEMIRLYRKLK